MQRLFIFSYFTFFAMAVFAQAAQIGNISVKQPWARFIPGASHNGAVYLSLTNHSQVADRLVSASSPHSKRIEIHTHTYENQVMRMRQLEHGIPLEPGKTVELAPGGMHLMVFGIDRPYPLGSLFPIVLHFEKAGKKTIHAIVQNQKNDEHVHH